MAEPMISISPLSPQIMFPKKPNESKRKAIDALRFFCLFSQPIGVRRLAHEKIFILLSIVIYYLFL